MSALPSERGILTARFCGEGCRFRQSWLPAFKRSGSACCIRAAARAGRWAWQAWIRAVAAHGHAASEQRCKRLRHCAPGVLCAGGRGGKVQATWGNRARPWLRLAVRSHAPGARRCGSQNGWHCTRRKNNAAGAPPWPAVRALQPPSSPVGQPATSLAGYQASWLSSWSADQGAS